MPDPDAATRRRVAACAATMAETAQGFSALGWMPATSGNLSMRLDATRAVVTASGRHKGRLTGEDVVVVAIADGHALQPTPTPSAETLLHTQVYRRFADAGAVVHTHSRHQSVASRLFATDGVVRLQGWELQKAITGFNSHDSTLELPIFPNSQHMPELAACVDAWLNAGKPLHAYLIAGHGMYVWGRDMDAARRHLEALDFLLGCELDLKRLSP